MYVIYFIFFFFNDTATTEIYTLSLHDALPIFDQRPDLPRVRGDGQVAAQDQAEVLRVGELDLQAFELRKARRGGRSEEHTSELQSRQYLVCRLLLEKKKQ